MYDGRDKNINSQTNSSIKYILNTYGRAQNENIYFGVCVRIFNR